MRSPVGVIAASSRLSMPTPKVGSSECDLSDSKGTIFNNSVIFDVKYKYFEILLFIFHFGEGVL